MCFFFKRFSLISSSSSIFKPRNARPIERHAISVLTVASIEV